MKKLHLICNSHIDPVWLWNKAEGMNAAVSTFRAAVNMAKEYDYIFCHNESVLYEYVEKVDPALFAEIKELVKKGKWKIMGGEYLQPDCLMPSGETQVRNICIGQKYFKEKFGAEPTVMANFDSFGHSVGLVQIFAKTGYKGYMICRPHFDFWREKTDWLLWKGLDGSSVKVFRDKFHYSSEKGKVGEKIENTVKYYDSVGKEVGLSLWGVGNHGGGPSREDLKTIERLQKTSSVEMVHSTLEQAFDEVSAEGVSKRSLVPCMVGCLTSNRAFKEKYAKLEDMLVFAEKLCSVAEITSGIKYPAEKLDAVWKDVLFGTFHDIMAGTCAEDGTIEAIDMIGHGLYETRNIVAETFSALAFNLKKSEEGKIPLCVFNPFPYKYKTIAVGEFLLPKIYFLKGEECLVKITDDNGNEILSQVVKESANFNVDWQKKVAFEVDLAPFEIKKYDASFEIVKARNKGVPAVKDAENIVFLVYDDNEDPWAQAESQYKRMGENPEEIPCVSRRVVESGDLFTVVEKEFLYGKSKIVLQEKHYKKYDFIDLSLRVYWNEQNKMLKMRLSDRDGEYIGQCPFGTDKLAMDGSECAAGRFVGVKSGEDVNAVINDGIYGSSYENGNIYISLLRSGAYAAHPATDPETNVRRPLVDENRFIPHFDQGEHKYEFRLVKAKENELERLADEFCQEPYVLNIFPDGTKERIRPDISLGNENITVKAMKKSDDGKGYILRLLNNSEKAAAAVVSFNGATAEKEFSPFEATTFVYDGEKLIENDKFIS